MAFGVDRDANATALKGVAYKLAESWRTINKDALQDTDVAWVKHAAETVIEDCDAILGATGAVHAGE